MRVAEVVGRFRKTSPAPPLLSSKRMQSVEAAEAPPVSRGTSPAGKALAFWGAALTVVALDQATKTAVRTWLDRGESWPDESWPLKLKHVTNSGAAFGQLQDQTTFLIVMACIGVVALYLYYRNPPFQHWLASVAVGLMLGGAAGNLIDRIRAGRVTDFVKPDNFPAFNVADSAINVGVAIILIGYLWFEQRKREPSNEDAPTDG